MPTVIAFQTIVSNTPQQNSGIFIGEINIGGWDAHVKSNTAQASVSGARNAFLLTRNLNVDSHELLDGLIFDQDFKPTWGVQC
ncbi:hypothetical protein [Alicyclobacillus vulcanalis]|uniref:Spore germination protein gerPA/gerPF n=1 Tax=Alicyclobacillus vulcanalis TaxID=252246 RepID=A0A1N7JS58_9BACL|nr:hypothetical protein [Alicyclobacillus vulcanalis]SIS52212.1 hypothetical protein SAMN05421799_101155 [Alicyclobacillus vulcanalis]